MRIRLAFCLYVLLALSLVACSDDPVPGDPDAAVVNPPDANPDCLEPTSVLPDNYRPINTVSTGTIQVLGNDTIVVDATAGGIPNAPDSPYIYLRFGETAVEKVDITDTESLADSSWDIALKRVVIRSNGGDSGPGGVTVAEVPGLTVADVTEAPADNLFIEDDWVTDDCQFIGGNINEPVTAFGVWYEYDPQTMRPDPPREVVYVVKRADGAMILINILTYYYNDGPGANYEIQWAWL